MVFNTGFLFRIQTPKLDKLIELQIDYLWNCTLKRVEFANKSVQNPTLTQIY